LKTVFHTLSNTHLFGASAGNGRLAILVLDGAALATGELDGSDDLVRLDIALGNAAKDDVLAIKPGGDDSGDKKLRAVAARRVSDGIVAIELRGLTCWGQRWPWTAGKDGRA